MSDISLVGKLPSPLPTSAASTTPLRFSNRVKLVAVEAPQDPVPPAGNLATDEKQALENVRKLTDGSAEAKVAAWREIAQFIQTHGKNNPDAVRRVATYAITELSPETVRVGLENIEFSAQCYYSTHPYERNQTALAPNLLTAIRRLDPLPYVKGLESTDKTTAARAAAAVLAIGNPVIVPQLFGIIRTSEAPSTLTAAVDVLVPFANLNIVVTLIRLLEDAEIPAAKKSYLLQALAGAVRHSTKQFDPGFLVAAGPTRQAKQKAVEGIMNSIMLGAPAWLGDPATTDVAKTLLVEVLESYPLSEFFPTDFLLYLSEVSEDSKLTRTSIETLGHRPGTFSDLARVASGHHPYASSALQALRIAAVTTTEQLRLNNSEYVQKVHEALSLDAFHELIDHLSVVQDQKSRLAGVAKETLGALQGWGKFLTKDQILHGWRPYFLFNAHNGGDVRQAWYVHALVERGQFLAAKCATFRPEIEPYRDELIAIKTWLRQISRRDESTATAARAAATQGLAVIPKR